MSAEAESRGAGGSAGPPARAGAVVGFDTATDDTAVAATRDGEVLYEVSIPPPEGGRPRHATALLGEVERAAEAAGGWNRVERLAVGTGPGSFTGIRIGVSTGRALAAALGIPAVGVGTLEALARGSGGRGLPVAAVLDGRRDEAFFALYGHRGELLVAPAVAAPAEAAERLAAVGERFLAVGSGALRFRGELAGQGAEVPDDESLHHLAASQTCFLAGDGAERGGPAPLYLRPPDAERWHERADLTRTGD